VKIEGYQFQANVITDDGTRAQVVLHVHPSGLVFAGTAGTPEPSFIVPDISSAEALVETVLREHDPVDPMEHAASILPPPPPPSPELQS
jgi:hypothetical protein